MKLYYTDRARNDLEIAFEWYEKQRRGLGYEFLDCVEVTVKDIRIFPEMYNICYSKFRRCLTRRFPFSIFYSIEGKEIIIHSVYDNRQDPGKRPSSH